MGVRLRQIVPVDMDVELSGLAGEFGAPPMSIDTTVESVEDEGDVTAAFNPLSENTPPLLPQGSADVFSGDLDQRISRVRDRLQGLGAQPGVREVLSAAADLDPDPPQGFGFGYKDPQVSGKIAQARLQLEQLREQRDNAERQAQAALMQRNRAVLDTQNILREGELALKEMKGGTPTHAPTGRETAMQALAGTAIATSEVVPGPARISVRQTDENRRTGCRRTTQVSVTTLSHTAGEPLDDGCEQDGDVKHKLLALTSRPSPLVGDDGSTHEALGRLAGLGPMPGAQGLDQAFEDFVSEAHRKHPLTREAMMSQERNLALRGADPAALSTLASIRRAMDELHQRAVGVREPVSSREVVTTSTPDVVRSLSELKPRPASTVLSAVAPQPQPVGVGSPSIDMGPNPAPATESAPATAPATAQPVPAQDTQVTPISKPKNTPDAAPGATSPTAAAAAPTPAAPTPAAPTPAPAASTPAPALASKLRLRELQPSEQHADWKPARSAPRGMVGSGTFVKDSSHNTEHVHVGDVEVDFAMQKGLPKGAELHPLIKHGPNDRFLNTQDEGQVTGVHAKPKTFVPSSFIVSAATAPTQSKHEHTPPAGGSKQEQDAWVPSPAAQMSAQRQMQNAAGYITRLVKELKEVRSDRDSWRTRVALVKRQKQEALDAVRTVKEQIRHAQKAVAALRKKQKQQQQQQSGGAGHAQTEKLADGVKRASSEIQKLSGALAAAKSHASQLETQQQHLADEKAQAVRELSRARQQIKKLQEATHIGQQHLDLHRHLLPTDANARAVAAHKTLKDVHDRVAKLQRDLQSTGGPASVHKVQGKSSALSVALAAKEQALTKVSHAAGVIRNLLAVVSRQKGEEAALRARLAHAPLPPPSHPSWTPVKVVSKVPGSTLMELEGGVKQSAHSTATAAVVVYDEPVDDKKAKEAAEKAAKEQKEAHQKLQDEQKKAEAKAAKEAKAHKEAEDKRRKEAAKHQKLDAGPLTEATSADIGVDPRLTVLPHTSQPVLPIIDEPQPKPKPTPPPPPPPPAPKTRASLPGPMEGYGKTETLERHEYYNRALKLLQDLHDAEKTLDATARADAETRRRALDEYVKRAYAGLNLVHQVDEYQKAHPLMFPRALGSNRLAHPDGAVIMKLRRIATQAVQIATVSHHERLMSAIAREYAAVSLLERKAAFAKSDEAKQSLSEQLNKAMDTLRRLKHVDQQTSRVRVHQ